MINIFIDTSAFYASRDKKDENFSKAISFFREIRPNPVYRLYTTNHVIGETATLIRARISIEKSIEFGTMLLQTTRITTIFVTPEMESRAWEFFFNYSDKDPSFIDCTSFVIMKELDISKAFTFDKHFKQFGLEQVP